MLSIFFSQIRRLRHIGPGLKLILHEYLADSLVKNSKWLSRWGQFPAGVGVISQEGNKQKRPRYSRFSSVFPWGCIVSSVYYMFSRRSSKTEAGGSRGERVPRLIARQAALGTVTVTLSAAVKKVHVEGERGERE